MNENEMYIISIVDVKLFEEAKYIGTGTVEYQN